MKRRQWRDCGATQDFSDSVSRPRFTITGPKPQWNREGAWLPDRKFVARIALREIRGRLLNCAAVPGLRDRSGRSIRATVLPLRRVAEAVFCWPRAPRKCM